MTSSDQPPFYQRHAFICTNERDDGKECCGHKGSLDLLKYMKDRLKAAGVSGAGKFAATKSGCLGRCALGPSMVIYPDNIWVFPKTTAEIDEVIERYFTLSQ